MSVDERQLVKIRLSLSYSQTLDSRWSLLPSRACLHVELVLGRPGEGPTPNQLEEHTTGLGKAILIISPPQPQLSKKVSGQDLFFLW